MTREERLAILGPTIVAHIHERVDAAPEPGPDIVGKLRRIMTNPAGPVPEPVPASALRLAPAVDAA